MYDSVHPTYGLWLKDVFTKIKSVPCISLLRSKLLGCKWSHRDELYYPSLNWINCEPEGLAEYLKLQGVTSLERKIHLFPKAVILGSKQGV